RSCFFPAGDGIRDFHVTGVQTCAFRSEAGARGTTYFRGGVGGANERLSWRLAASRYATDGFSAYATGTEDDGYDNTGLSGRLNLKITDAVSLDLRSVWSSGRADFDAWKIGRASCRDRG